MNLAPLFRFLTLLACLTLAACDRKPALDSPAVANNDSVTATEATAAIPKNIHAAKYVPDSICSDCHGEVHETFQHMGMGRSFYRPSAENLVEDFENNHFFHEASNRHYEMVRLGDDVYQRRYQLDESGARINEFEEKVDWIMGSGNHGRTYLYQNDNGEIFEMPLKWQTAYARWGMGPGKERADHNGFRRRITRDCMFCHNAYPTFEPESDALSRPPIFPKELPQGIGCQRCHGPGSDHVELASMTADESSVEDWKIVNPIDLAPDLQQDVCLQCHLQPHSSFHSLVRKAGRDDYSFRPGQPLSDYLAVVDFTPDENQEQFFQINHHGYRLHQSKCFIKSEGAMSCLTCHDPHSHIPKADAKAHYRDACISCHQFDDCGKIRPLEAAEQAESDCVSCHMPEQRTSDVVLITMTDHRIQTHIAPEEQRLAPIKKIHTPQLDSIVLGLHEVSQKLTNSSEDSSEDLYVAIAGTSTGKPEYVTKLEKAIGKTPPKSFEPYWYLAAAQLKQGDLQSALSTLSLIEEKFPDVTDSLVLTGSVLLKLKKLQAAREKFESAIDVGIDTPECHFGLGKTLWLLGDKGRGEHHLRRALSLRPQYYDALYDFGATRMQVRRFKEAVELYRQALAVDPTSVDAYQQMGFALMYSGDFEEAARYWQHGAKMTGAARLFESEAMAYLNMEQFDKALAVSKSIVGGDPCIPELLRAIIGFHQGNKADGQLSYETAERLAAENPLDSNVRRILFSSASKLSARN